MLLLPEVDIKWVLYDVKNNNFPTILHNLYLIFSQSIENHITVAWYFAYSYNALLVR